MKGTVAGTLERGVIRQSPALRQLRETLGAEAPPDVPFQIITHAARIEQGRLLLDKATGDLGKDLFSLSGALGFDQTLDLDALLRLAPSRVAGGGFLAQLARYARDAEGRIPVEVKITGTALAPKVSVRPGRLIAEAGTQLIKDELTKFLGGARRDSAAADSVAGSGGSRGGGLLEQLFGRKKATPKPPKPPAATPPAAAPDSARAASPAPRDSAARRDSVANPVQKALDRLLGQ
jgi:hypothetical protein